MNIKRKYNKNITFLFLTKYGAIIMEQLIQCLFLFMVDPKQL